MTDSGISISRTAVACYPDVAMDEIKRTISICNTIDRIGVEKADKGTDKGTTEKLQQFSTYAYHPYV